MKFKGDNAMHIAAKQENKSMLTLLAKYNSDFQKKNNNGETVFDILKNIN